MKSQQKGIAKIFEGGVTMNGLKGKSVGDYPQQKWIMKNRRQDVQCVDEF